MDDKREAIYNRVYAEHLKASKQPFPINVREAHDAAMAAVKTAERAP